MCCWNCSSSDGAMGGGRSGMGLYSREIGLGNATLAGDALVDQGLPVDNECGDLLFQSVTQRIGLIGDAIQMRDDLILHVQWRQRSWKLADLGRIGCGQVGRA